MTAGRTLLTGLLLAMVLPGHGRGVAGHLIEVRQAVVNGACVADNSSRAGDGADFPKGVLTGYGNSIASTNFERVDALGRVTRVRQAVAGLANDAL
jgi:hypothetical protein